MVAGNYDMVFSNKIEFCSPSRHEFDTTKGYNQRKVQKLVTENYKKSVPYISVATLHDIPRSRLSGETKTDRAKEDP